MAVVYVNPIYLWQVSPNGLKAASTQMDYRSMIGEVTSWNPNLDPQEAGRMINNYYRAVIDMRSWYGLKIRGQVSVGAPYNQGQVAVQLGNPIVTGTGTGWTLDLVGYAFRIGFTSAYQIITGVNVAAQTLQLETPYAGSSIAVSGYQMTDCYVDFGANIKRLLWSVNQQQGWYMECNTKVETINAWDTWRTNLGWSKHFATRSMSPSGSMIKECWPAPASAQAFPFEAYQQPPELVNDADCMVPWIRTDVITGRAVADACLKGGTKSEYFNPTVAQMKIAQFDKTVEEMVGADDNMDVQDVTWSYGEEGESNGTGSTWQQMHA